MLGIGTIKFADNKVHTTPSYNTTLDKTNNYDKTFASSVCPIIVNSLPFHWEMYDIDGVKWQIDIAVSSEGQSTTTLTYQFSIGSFNKTVLDIMDPSSTNNEQLVGLPFAIWFQLTYNYQKSGYRVYFTRYPLQARYNIDYTYYSRDAAKGSLLDGVVINEGGPDGGSRYDSAPFVVGTPLAEVIASYQGNQEKLCIVNLSTAGSARFVVQGKNQSQDTDYVYGYGTSGYFWNLYLDVGSRSAFSWEGDATPEGDGSMQLAVITLDPTMYYYDGQFKTPTVTVKINDVQLTEGTDYIKTYENNRDPGLASVLVAGQGSYTGSKRVYFSIYASKNPYGNLEPSGPSNTTPTYNYTSDSVGKPPVPTLSMSDIGFVRIYNPSKTQLQSLAAYLWTDSTFLDTIVNHAKQLLENPIDGIICLNLLPCDIPNGGTEEFKLLFVPTGVQLTVAANQFVEVNCGKVTIETVYGSALDYAPYTKASMFLPYVGQVSLNIDEIMGKTLRVYYHIDIVSGGCVAIVEVDGTVMYQFSGHCAISMPLTGADYSNLASAMISTVKAAATMGANAGAGIAQAAMEMMSGSSRQNDSTTKTLPGEALVAVGEGIEFTSLAARNIANTVGAVMGSKPEISRTGTFSGNTGYLGVRRPYVILERPRLCNPSEYGKFNGYPSMQTVTLNNISGFTQVQQVQLTGISATASELNEIEKLLKSGVIL